MKICLINSLYEPYSRGGAEQVVRNIARGLKTAPGEVFIITSSIRPGQAEIGGIRVFYIKPWNLFWFGDINQKPAWLRLFWHGLDMFNFSGRNQVKKILEKERPDVVNTHNLKGVSYLIPRLIKKMGIKHFHTIHDVQLANPSGLMIVGKEKEWPIYKTICRWLFNSPDVVISPSQWLLGFYKNRGFFKKSKLIHLPNPIIVKDKLEKKEADNNLLFIGQLEKHKGILFLIEALLSCHPGAPTPVGAIGSPSSTEKTFDFHLAIAGDGSQKEKVKELIKDDGRFELLGKVEHEKISELFQKARYTIVPSLCYENSPTVIYESLAGNTPVIAADIGGGAELIRDGENGFIFKAGDKEDLIEKIKKALATKLDGKLVGDYSMENYLKLFI